MPLGGLNSGPLALLLQANQVVSTDRLVTSLGRRASGTAVTALHGYCRLAVIEPEREAGGEPRARARRRVHPQRPTQSDLAHRLVVFRGGFA